MEHIYKEHYKRKVTSLNGDWEFCIDTENKGRTEKWFENFPESIRNINVPGCWNLEFLDLFSYMGGSLVQKRIRNRRVYIKNRIRRRFRRMRGLP